MISIIRNIAPWFVFQCEKCRFRIRIQSVSGSFIRNHSRSFLVIHEPVVRRAFYFLLDALSVCRGLRQLDGKKYRSVARMIFSCQPARRAALRIQSGKRLSLRQEMEMRNPFCYFRISRWCFRLSLQPSFCLPVHFSFFIFELGDSLLEHFVRLFVKRGCSAFCHAVYSLILRSILGDLCLGCCQRGEAGAE